MQLSLSEIEQFRNIGFYEIVFTISMRTVDHELSYSSFNEYLRSIAVGHEKHGAIIVMDLIPTALGDDRLTVLLAEAFAFSYHQPEFDEQNPRAFLEFVRNEILKMLESNRIA